MSYGTTDPAGPPVGRPGDAQLADRGWRVRHSLWLLAPLLGCGAFSFVGFLYCAIRVGTRRWWLVATFWTLASVAVWTMAIVQGETGRSGPYDDIGAVLLIVVYLAAIVHALILNRDYLRWRATSRPWYTHPPAAAPPATGPLMPPPSPPPTTPPGRRLLDLNTASRDQVALLPGVDDATAARVVAAREARGGFTDLDDAVRSAGLQPHQLVLLRDQVTVGPTGAPGSAPQGGPAPQARPEQPQRPGGRVLDI